MASQYQQLHFVLIPLMCPGHMIPLVDLGKLLSAHGVNVTLFTTPLNAARFKSSTNSAMEDKLSFQILEVEFPALKVGLPEGCENIDSLPSRSLSKQFFDAARLMQEPIEEFLKELQPYPSCIISDRNLPWTVSIAKKFHIPRLMFDGSSCFTIMCSHFIKMSKIHERVEESEYFTVPGLPGHIKLTRAQLPHEFNPGPVHIRNMLEEVEIADSNSYGLVVNSFEELEGEYVSEYKMAKGKKIWCIGPVSLANKVDFVKAQRGNKNSIDEKQCMAWLDAWPTSSVVYACLGSISSLTHPQMIELGLGLEESRMPFIWVIRESKSELEKWITESGFQERTKERGLVIKGWAPQVLILSHPSIGAFLTHCGWNSTLEGVAVGVPMITWPLFFDQFYNERFIVNVIKTGVEVGAYASIQWSEDEKAPVMVKKEQVMAAIGKVIDGGKQGEERRKRAKEFMDKAKNAVGNGSSYLNVVALIEDVMQQVTGNK